MIDTVFGTKIESTRKFTRDGVQVPVTKIMLQSMVITQVKDKKKDGYQAIQIGIGEKKLTRLRKPQQGHIKGAGLKEAPLYFREAKANDLLRFKLGETIKPAQILEAGDLVNVTGISKGKGFAGVMKRWNFSGGPRTHGQSDRERAPGSIGQSATPGRVFKGKKMPGRLGNARKTIRNLQILSLDEKNKLLLVKGLVPGARNGLLEIKKMGKAKRFIALMKEGEGIIGADGDKKKKKEKEEGNHAKN